jgi:fibronectin-binding autotransporter adhesin
VGTVTLDGAGLISGTGTLTSTGSFEMKSGTVNAVLGGSGIALNKTTAGTVVLNNQNTYTGNTNVMAGKLILAGTATPNLSTSTAVTVATGANLVVNGDNTVASLTSNGTVSGDKTLTAPVYNLNDGTVISAKLGNVSTSGGSVVNVNGAVSFSNTVAANTINVQTGMLTLNGVDLLSHQATLGIASAAALTLTGGDQTVANLNGSGKLTLNGYNLNVTNGGAYSGTTISTGNLNKTGSGTLTLSGDNQFTQGTSVNSGTVVINANGSLSTNDTVVNNGGTLVDNGTINSNVLVNAGGTIKGSGNITGNFTGNGTTAPGNSPGVLSVAGNYAENGTLQIEVGGVSAPGATTGYDQVAVGGKTVLNSATSVLQIKQYNGFSLDKGQVATVIKGAPGTISGTFSSVTSDMSKDVILNRSTGQLVGTGLNTGASTDDLAVSLAQGDVNVRNLVNGMKIGDHQYAGGDFVPLLLQSGLTAADVKAIGGKASPEAYASLVDYAGHVTLSYVNAVADMPSVAQNENYSVFAGYANFQGSASGSVQNADYSLRSHGNVFGVKFNVAPNLVAGAYLGSDSGSQKSSYLSGSTKGEIYGVYAEYKPEMLKELTLIGGYTVGDFSNSGTRVTNGTAIASPGLSQFSGVGSSSNVLSLAGKYKAFDLGGIYLQPEGRISYVQSSVDGFSETNTNQLQALSVHEQRTHGFVTEAAVSAFMPVTSQFSVNGKLSLVHDGKNTARGVTANVVSESESFSVKTPGVKSTALSLGAGAAYKFNEKLTVSGSYRKNISGGLKSGQALYINAAMAF